jgi:hypothetical protein
MPRWLKWWLGLFLGINALAVVGNFPNPFTLLWAWSSRPAPEARSMDGLTHGLNLILGIGMLLGWAVLGLVLAIAMRERKKTEPAPAADQDAARP